LDPLALSLRGLSFLFGPLAFGLCIPAFLLGLHPLHLVLRPIESTGKSIARKSDDKWPQRKTIAFFFLRAS
jgi:hypothetical protein